MRRIRRLRPHFGDRTGHCSGLLARISHMLGRGCRGLSGGGIAGSIFQLLFCLVPFGRGVAVRKGARLHLRAFEGAFWTKALLATVRNRASVPPFPAHHNALNTPVAFTPAGTPPSGRSVPPSTLGCAAPSFGSDPRFSAAAPRMQRWMVRSVASPSHSPLRQCSQASAGRILPCASHGAGRADSSVARRCACAAVISQGLRRWKRNTFVRRPRRTGRRGTPRSVRSPLPQGGVNGVLSLGNRIAAAGRRSGERTGTAALGIVPTHSQPPRSAARSSRKAAASSQHRLPVRQRFARMAGGCSGSHPGLGREISGRELEKKATLFLLHSFV